MIRTNSHGITPRTTNLQSSKWPDRNQTMGQGKKISNRISPSTFDKCIITYRHRQKLTKNNDNATHFSRMTEESASHRTLQQQTLFCLHLFPQLWSDNNLQCRGSSKRRYTTFFTLKLKKKTWEEQYRGWKLCWKESACERVRANKRDQLWFCWFPCLFLYILQLYTREQRYKRAGPPAALQRLSAVNKTDQPGKSRLMDGQFI